MPSPTVSHDVRIRTSDRVALFGRTGSGKTTLVRALLSRASRFVVLDPKHRFTMPDVPVLTHFDKKLERQIIRSPIEDGLDGWDAAIDETFWRGRAILYSDETTEFTSKARISTALKRAIVQGRETGVGVWCASQRPTDIHSVVFTEAEHVFVFQLNFEADMEKVARFTHERMIPAISALRGHNYVYFDMLGNRILRFRSIDLSRYGGSHEIP